MSRVLFYTEAWGKGGIEAFIRNVTPPLMEMGHKVDIVSTWEWPDICEPALDELGVKRHTTFPGHRPNQLRRLDSGLKTFNRLLKDSNYDAVWINTMNGMGFLYAREAYRLGVPIRIVHSHNSDVGDGLKVLKRFVGRSATMLLRKYATCNIACSRLAGEYLFAGAPFHILPNGIDISRFCFSESDREKVRKELGVSDSNTLIGNIGRINSQKNPLFQIEIFAAYLNLDPTAKYLMLGGGEMRDEVLRLAQKFGISSSLVVTSPVNDPAPYYSALDAFLMPSLYEGLPFAKIEAQCASLPVICTEGMPVDSDVTDLVSHCSLTDSPNVWANQLQTAIVRHRFNRDSSYADEIDSAGFSIEKCCSIMDSFLTT